MVSGDFCRHDWPGSGCPDCKAEAAIEGPCEFDDCQEPGRCDGRNCLRYPGTIRLEPEEIEEAAKLQRIAENVAYCHRQAMFWREYAAIGYKVLEGMQEALPRYDIFGKGEVYRERMGRQMASNRMRYGTSEDYMRMAEIIRETGYEGEFS